jgi:hypothetical protein
MQKLWYGICSLELKIFLRKDGLHVAELDHGSLGIWLIIASFTINGSLLNGEVIEETKPYFTHKGAEEIVTSMEEEIDLYAARFAVFADKVWRKEYLKEPSVTTSCASSSIGQTSTEIGASVSMKSN